MQNPKEHWEKVYQTKQPDAVSWFQEHATRSLELIRSVGPSLQANVMDVGGGASTLVDDLLSNGFHNVSVLDLSASALEIAHQRLGAAGDCVTWLAGDICTVDLPDHAYDIWHDRAVFHFLTDPADRAAYVRQVMKAVKPGGHVIVATFAPDGPEQCSGLPVARYAPGELHQEFGPSFELLEHMSEEHKTPWGAVQHFVYCHCLKPH
ncbi:class I SAM-dependent methyltransferase [Acidovorax sp. D2M1]|uniref:Class I SAM-dependent methyltransferase n=1 Tax=Acidovorax benzenivorans TaxID=2987520 RepID=A0ABT5S356_9BURK|nr:class I SAM-dependent methyltransferase [Acidovorax benzenivorans]MDD2180390.1 class I SAM-dependent methyltransferase [Acidovorax benzenivorans]